MAQAHELQLGLMQEQDRMAGERQAAANKFAKELEGIRSQNDLDRQLKVGKQNSTLNRKSNRQAAEIKEGSEIDDALMTLGIDPAKYGDVNEKKKALAGERSNLKSLADEAQSRLDEAERMLSGLSAKVELPITEKVRIARNALIKSAAGDAAKIKEYSAFTSLDQIEKAADETTLDGIQKALDAAQKNRMIVIQQKAAPYKHAADLNAKRLSALERQKIFPTISGVQANDAEDAGTDNVYIGGGNDNLSEVFAPKTLPATAPTNYLGDALSSFNPMHFVNALGRASGAVASGLTGNGFRMPEQSPLTTAGESLGAFIGGSVGDEAQRQRGQLAALDAMIRRAQDPRLAGKLRAARYAPEIPSFDALMAGESDPNNLALLRAGKFNLPMLMGN
jgi:hypothetical protein